MPTIGFFTKEDTVRLLHLLEKAGIEAEVGYDEKFAHLYRDTFGIEPLLKRRSSFRMPKIGWFILYKEHDDARVRTVVLNSPFAYCLTEPDNGQFPGEEADDAGQEVEQGNENPEHNSGIWKLILFLSAFLLCIAYLFKGAR